MSISAEKPSSKEKMLSTVVLQTDMRHCHWSKSRLPTSAGVILPETGQFLLLYSPQLLVAAAAAAAAAVAISSLRV